MMPIILVIILDLLLLYFFFGDGLLQKMMPLSWRERRKIRDLKKALKARFDRCRDVMQTAQQKCYSEAIALAEKTLAENHPGEIKKLCRRIDQDEFDGLLQPLYCGWRRWAAEYLEILVVSVGVAFGIRSLLIQPFKIPTGSMQPTLFGIHYVPLDKSENCRPGTMKRLFDYVNYSRRYIDFSAGNSPVLLDVRNLRAMSPWMVIFPRTLLPFANLFEKGGICIPADLDNSMKALESSLGGNENLRAHMSMRNACLQLAPGETLFHGAMESGDHLFVNRMSLAFRSPRRGEVMVFSTKGLSYMGRPLAGDFYIKRLIGLPGDTLKIVCRQVWLKPAGEAEFLKLDEKIHPSFRKIYSMEQGYHGHSTVGRYGVTEALREEGEEYTVPDGYYFLMGDNTDNSLDCRFFGPVPRENLVGRPCFVWWPFTKRFGLVDRPLNL